MKKLLLLFCFLAATCISFSQKTINDPNAEMRQTGAFIGISVSSGIDLYLSHGDEAVAISAGTAEHRDRIKTEVQNGVLKIWHENKSGISITWNSDRKLRAYVSYRTLKSITASGGSDVEVDGTIKTNELRLEISGGSDFKGAVETENLRVNQSGGSDIHISGRAVTLSVDASGGSDFNGYNLITESCDLEASGGSDIEITAHKEISATATGASDISYKGKPEVKQMKASGASSIKPNS